MLRTFFLGFSTFSLLSLASPIAMAESLAGSWSGTGSVHYSQTREKARCRAEYARISGTLYRMNATCATPSGRVDQTATVNRVGDGEYAGQFHNSQYNVSGSIYVRLRGGSQTVHLTGSGGGSGSFSLRRR